MVGRVSCPVCTLFLHPGMTLEDHLETHPKEQVIKALVALSVKSALDGKTVEVEEETTHTAITERIRSPCSSKHGTKTLVDYELCSNVKVVPAANQNVMIFKRQSTMLYHSPPSTTCSTSTLSLSATNACIQKEMTDRSFPSLQIVSIPNNNRALPPPPAYGAAISQLRSQNSQSHSNLSIGFSARDLQDNDSNFSSASTLERPNASSSVLRFAESPISAHYVEKENGDFLLQETPRHIVECIEKDDGEFAVTEKLIGSPPSVLQFNEYEINENIDNVSQIDSECQENDIDEEIEETCNNNTNCFAGVTVISDVKLDTTESLDLMNGIISSTPDNKVIVWKEICETDKDEDEELDVATNDNVEENYHVEDEKSHEILSFDIEDVKPITEDTEACSSVPCTTSVIRMVTNSNHCDDKISNISNSSGSKDTPQKPKYCNKVWEQNFGKNPFKKHPKKLVVKFKNKPPELINVVDDIDLTKSDENYSNSNSGTSHCRPNVQNIAKKINTLEQNVDIDEDHDRLNSKNATSNQMVWLQDTLEDRSTIKKKEETESEEKAKDDFADILFHANSTGSAENVKVCIVDDSGHVIETCNGKPSSSSSILNKADDNPPKYKVEIINSTLLPMVVHEPTLNEEISPEKKQIHEFEQVYNNASDKNDLTKLVSRDDNDLESDKSFASSDTKENKNLNLDTVLRNEAICNFEGESQSKKRIENASRSNSCPTTSQMSQPSTSSFTFEDQIDYSNEQNYTDYSFNFLYSNEKNRLSPVSTENRQIWTGGYEMLSAEEQIQVSEIDIEKENIVNLESYKRTNTNDVIHLSSALNIRTDEKMPAKGEISEQESNGDIENSWSQPMCRESSFQISSSYDTGVARGSWGICNENAVYPKEISAEIKPKFYFGPPFDDEMQANDTLNLNAKNDRLQNILIKGENSQQTVEKKKQRTTDPTKRKQFQCIHCPEKFGYLKERSHHMIEMHGYKRINRKIVREIPTATITTSEAQSGTSGPEEDVKPLIESKVLEVSTTKSLYPRTKIDSIRAGVYRMLMNFNLSVYQEKTKIDPDRKLFDSKYFVCFTCKAEFISVKTFDEHLQEHPAECYTCSRKFIRWTYLSLHLKRHLGWKDFACSFCNKKFVIRSAMIEHMRMHTGCAPLKCSVCEKHFKRYSNLAQHKKICHKTKKVSKKEYVCHCGEVLPSKARFAWHKETHDKKPKCCPYCRDRFVHMNSLKRHIRLTHSDKFNYAQPVQCPMCNGMYSKASLKTHMATHTMDAQHECPICNKTFSTKWNLKIHSWVHANRTAKPFKCEQCVKAFVREHDYKNHLNSHNHIKPYTCEYCGCKFIRKYNYMRHRREHHGQKKFKCDLCHKLFHRHYYLIEHRRTHTGERPFLCTICGKSSTTKTNHNKHLKIHHSRDPFVAEA